MLATTRYGTPGASPALLAHCYLGHAGTWRGLMAALRTPLDALAFDMPGHGRSPLSAPPVDYHAEVAGLFPGLLAQVAPDGRPALLIGHSFGAAAALRHALERPATVAGLVLIEPVFFAAAAGMPEHADWIAASAPIDLAVAEGRLDDAVTLFLQQNGDGTPYGAMPPAARALLRRQIAMMPSSTAGLVEDRGQLLAPGRMAAFPAPVLLLAGAASPPIYPAICRGLAARLGTRLEAGGGGARLELLPEAGHMLPITHAAQVAARIDSWLATWG